MNDLYCVIMAGGKGERFWPCSRENTPKQLQNIIGRETLIEQTVLRLVPLAPFENILIITNWKYVDPIRSGGSCRSCRRKTSSANHADVIPHRASR